jgi:hypothetical protein
VLPEKSASKNELYWMHGHQEAAARAVALAERLDAILITPSYGLCSLISFYAPGQPETHLFAPSGVYGLNYRFWDEGFRPWGGRNAVFISDAAPSARLSARLSQAYERVGEVESVHFHSEGKVARTFYLIPCHNLVRPQAAAGE